MCYLHIERWTYIKSHVPSPLCAGFHGAERKRLAELAQALGGSYAPDLVAGTTSHLVCKRLIDAVGGPKHTAALRWGVKVVSAAWLEDSAAAGRVQPEAAYKDDPPAAWQPSPWQQPSTARTTVTHSHQQPQPTLQRQQLAPGSSADRAWRSAEAGSPDLFMPTAPASSTLAQSAATTASAAPFSFTQLPAAAHSSSPPSWGGLPSTGEASAVLTPPAAAVTVGTGGGSSHAVGGQAAAASMMYAGRNSSSSSGADHTQHQQQHNQQQRCSSMAAVEDEDVWVPETQADWGQGLEEPELGQLSLGGAAVGTTAASPAQAHGGGVGGVETAEEPQEQAQQQRQPQTVQEEQDQLQHDVAQQQDAALSNSVSTAAASAVEAAAAPATHIPPDCKEASSSATTHLTRLRRLRRRAAVPAASPDAPSRCHQAGDSELEDSGCSEAEEDQLEDSSSADEECEPTSSRQQPQDTAATAGGHQGGQLPRRPHLGGQSTPGQLLTPGCSMSGSSWPDATPASAATTSSSLPITRLSFSGLAGGGSSSSSSKDTQQHQQRHQQGVQGGCPSTSASSSVRSRGSAGRSLSLSRTSAALAAAAAARPADIEALRQEQQRQRAARKAAAASAAASGVSQSEAPEVTQQVQEAEHDEHDELEEVVADSDELVDEASSGEQHQAPQQQHMQQAGAGDCLLSPAYHQEQQAGSAPGSGQLPASATSFITKRRCGGGRGGCSGRAGDAAGAGQGPDDQAAHSPIACAAAAATRGVEHTDAADVASEQAAAACPEGGSCQLPEEDTTTPPTQSGRRCRQSRQGVVQHFPCCAGLWGVRWCRVRPCHVAQALSHYCPSICKDLCHTHKSQRCESHIPTHAVLPHFITLHTQHPQGSPRCSAWAPPRQPQGQRCWQRSWAAACPTWVAAVALLRRGCWL